MNSRANWSFFSSFDSAAVNRLLPPLVSLLLVVLIGWQLARVIWMLMPGSGVGVAVALPDSLPQTSSTSRASLDVAAIANSHIFGVADAESDKPALIVTPDDDLADTRLVNLVLNGTVASEIPNYSVAIISDGGKDQEVYIIGDPVGNNAKLHHRDKGHW